MNEILVSLLAGLSIGFLGSIHCAGMCGPIALTLPIHQYKGWQKAVSISLYNSGRAITYGMLGLVFGFMGNQFRLWGLQQWVSISAGIFILLFILSNFSFTSKIPWLSKVNIKVQASLSRLLQSPKNPGTFLPIGLLNGLLPCGLVYVAIAAALATSHTWHGALLMIAFGFGTFPMMAGLMIFGHLLSFQFRRKLNRAVPVLVGMMAVVLILRGMNLGIPYLSPALEKNSTEVSCCHKPQ